MQYFFKFEGNEKLLFKIMFVVQVIIVCLCVYLALAERPIDVEITLKELKGICNAQ